MHKTRVVQKIGKTQDARVTAILFYSTLFYSGTTTIPNKMSSWSSATVNQAILLGH